MGSCIICGTSTDGHVCDTHQEDVLFEFQGNSASQLTEGRYYRGTVDGYADFGVFVDLSPGVTGLLHRSKIDKRLESLDWEPGDTVYVQVNNVRDNGDIDLGWSIRQSEREFRGSLVQTPEGDEPAEDESGNADSAAGTGPATATARGGTPDTDEGASDGGTTEVEPDEPSGDEGTTGDDATDESAADAESSDDDGGFEFDDEDAGEESSGAEYERAAVETLSERVGDRVRLEGEVASARQTSGPTVFELRDETGMVDCAAFEEAGVRAYPEVEQGDVVRLDGEVRVRRDELQVETEALVALEGDERDAVLDRMEAALDEEASPDDLEPLTDDPVVADALEDLRDVAATVRRAVLESRPVVVRHAATADGYVAGAAIERATLPLVEDEHASADATYHYFDRRPLEDGVYGMDDATNDVSRMLDNHERHDEKLPLFVFAAAGSTRDSLDGLELLEVYGAETAVVDGPAPDAEVRETAATVASADGERTATTLAATAAVGVNADVREDLRHLPAVSYWTDTPAGYADLAGEAGVDADTARQLREAVALEAYYQTYEDKRELVIDLLFDEADGQGLAAQAAEQFNEKLDAELETAEANLERREVGGATFAVLDTDAYTHRFEFPPTALLLDALHRRTDAPVTVGVAKDELYLRSDADLTLRAVAGAARERAPNAGLSARGTRLGKLVFLSGERDAALDAVLESVAERL